MTNLQAQSDGRKLRLDIYDMIGEDFFGGGITAKGVAEQIADAGEEVEQIEVHINSPGGDAFDGVAIYNQLKQFPGQVNVFVDGVAASAASVIAMAGDQRIVSTGGQIMIHNGAGFTFGDKKVHQKQARTLGKLDKGIAEIYAEATGNDVNILLEMMDEETWMDADDALDDGFATHIAPAEAVPTPSLRLLNHFKNVPKKVAALAGQAVGTPTPTMELSMATKPKNEEVTPEEPEKDEPLNEEEAEEKEEETMESLKARIAELEAQLAEQEGDEEEGEKEEEGGGVTNLTVKFVNESLKTIKALREDNSRLSALADGAPDLALAKGAKQRDEKTVNTYKAAKAISNTDARSAYLASIGADEHDFSAWAKAQD